MPVKLIPLTCPKCGGKLQIPEGAEKCFCTFCGTQIAVDDGNVTFNVHNFDEAELRRIELERERYEREERERAEQRQLAQEEAARAAEHRRRWRIALVAFIAVILLMSIVSNPLKEGLPQVYGVFSTIMGAFVIIGAIALFVQRPGKKGRAKDKR